MTRTHLVLAAAFLDLQACSAGERGVDGFAQLKNVVQLWGGSGVYVGDGLALTNWHVCSTDRGALLYNDPGTTAERYREGTALDARCASAQGASCAPLAELSFDPAGPAPGPIAEVVFASKAIDLCILQLTPDEIPSNLMPLSIDIDSVQVGQQVVIAGYPLAESRKHVERCRVTDPTRSVRDPDEVHTSDSEVMSFAIDCMTPQHGSSGSPVFDAETGLLLGLLWTGVCTERGKCSGPFYVSDASRWRAVHADRPLTQYSRLDALLRAFVRQDSY